MSSSPSPSPLHPLPDSNVSLTYTSPSSPPHLTHTPLPKISPQQILVKVHAAAINPVDIQLWGNPVLGWVAGRKEKGIGRDYAGVVVKVGGDVNGGKGGEIEGEEKWEVGMEVWGLCNRATAEGTFTQYLAITPSTEPIAIKPPNITHAEAASLPLVVLTAFAMLDWLPPPPSPPTSVTHASNVSHASHAPPAQQRRVIVSGASGGVGIWVVQLAKKLYNCHVTGICSGKNAQFVRELGADEVIDYTTEDVKQRLLGMVKKEKEKEKEREVDDGGSRDRKGNVDKKGGKFDLYADCVGGTEVFGYWHSLLHPSASYTTIVGDKTARTSMGGPLTYFTYPSQILRYLRGYLFGPRYANVMLYQESRLLRKVAGLVERGEVQVVVQEVVAGILDEEGFGGAWERVRECMEGGRVRGKVCVGIA